METEKTVPLLSPPPSPPSEEETLVWEQTDQTEASAKPDTADIADTAEETPSVSDGGEKTSDEPNTDEKYTDRENAYGEGRNPLRFFSRTGMLLLGLFSAAILITTAIDGIDRLREKGIPRLILGELFGGSANIGVLPPETEPLTLSEPLNLSTVPANEQETEGDETVPSPSVPENGQLTIVSADLSSKGENGLTLINETPYTPALLTQSERAIPTLSELYEKYGSHAPVVLILHTHATESFAENGAEFTSETEYRSLDPSKNMLAVGRTLAEVLRSRGINVIHCEEMFDAEDFTMAYYNASLKIRKVLQEYPSVSYILDLHRDSIAYAGGGETIRPVTVIDGKPCAQMMFVTGTDHGGSNHTEWTDNFNLACRLQSRIFESHSGLMRSINLRSASFNQQYTKGSLLIEMGAVGSSVEEACNSAEILGKFLAEEIIGDMADAEYLRKAEEIIGDHGKTGVLQVPFSGGLLQVTFVGGLSHLEKILEMQHPHALSKAYVSSFSPLARRKRSKKRNFF